MDKVNRAVFLAVALMFCGAALFAGSPNGSAGDMPTYYDGNLFTINFKELSSNAEVSLLRSNHSINVIYMCDACEAAGLTFTSVLDAIQRDGFNPLWQEVQIMFNDGFAPVQLTSDTDILAAAALPNPSITLVPTNEVYRCSVVGPRR